MCSHFPKVTDEHNTFYAASVVHVRTMQLKKVCSAVLLHCVILLSYVLHQGFSTWGTRTPRGTPQHFQGVRVRFLLLRCHFKVECIILTEFFIWKKIQTSLIVCVLISNILRQFLYRTSPMTAVRGKGITTRRTKKTALISLPAPIAAAIDMLGVSGGQRAARCWTCLARCIIQSSRAPDKTQLGINDTPSRFFHLTFFAIIARNGRLSVKKTAILSKQLHTIWIYLCYQIRERISSVCCVL